MEKEDSCHFCKKPAVTIQRIPIDADVVHDGDEYEMMPLYGNVGLCQEHFEAWEDGELYKQY